MKEEQKNLLKIIGYIGFFVILIYIARMSLNKTEVIKEENNGVNYIKSIIDMSEDFYKMNIHYVMDDDAITLDFEKQNDILIGEKYYHKVVDKFVNYNNKYYVLDNDNFVEDISFDIFPYDKTFLDFKNLKELINTKTINIIKKDNEVTYKYNLNDFLTTYNKINKTNYYTLEDKSVSIVFTFNNEKINDISIDATSIYNLINNTEYKMIQYKVLVEEVSKDDTTWIKEKLS
jgi:hypothetical protein